MLSVLTAQPLPARRRSRPRRFAALVMCVLLVGGGVVAIRSWLDRPSGLVWSDEFDGPVGSIPAEDHWTREAGDFGWPANTLECMAANPGNAHLDGAGRLDLTALYLPGTPCSRGTKDFTSARLTTHDHFAMTYGRVEIRAKLAPGRGMWNALWLLGDNYSDVGWPACGEIDISEVTSANPTSTYATVHGPKPDADRYAIAGQRDGLTSMFSRFHTYGLTWSPNRLRITYDDWLYLTVTREQVQRDGGAWVFDHGFDIVLNLAVGGDWPGNPAAADVRPATMQIDWVRVYSA